MSDDVVESSQSRALAPLAVADPKSILDRYLSDESTKDIAKSYGVTRQALGQFLLKTAESEWKEAQVARAIARKEQAEDDYEAICKDLDLSVGEEKEKLRDLTQLSLARLKGAELRLKAAQWDLERVCRRIYGQDAPDQKGAGVTISINLGGNNASDAVKTARIIDGDGAEIKN